MLRPQTFSCRTARNSPARALVIATISALATFLVSVPLANANQKYAGYVLDANSGVVLYADRAEEKRYPASLTKMMTLYLTFEGLDAGRFKTNSKITVSRKAAAEPPSKLGIRAGGTITVDDAMHALVTKSANDVATALGEFLAGSEEKFAAMATAKARSLGMHSTRFRNAHGLPDTRQVTTARDMAMLGLALREHFPHHYGIFQTRAYKIGGQTLRSHNRLVGSYSGVDGIKTGYIRASGFNLVTSVKANGRSVIAVVLGGRTGASRDAHMRDLLNRYLPKATQNRAGGLQLVHARELPQNLLPVSGPLLVEQAVDRLVTGAVPGGSGSWAIQIAAVPQQDQALAILGSAQAKFAPLLSQATPLVTRVTTKDTSLYRVRFVGFAGVEHAQNACEGIKGDGGGCWVMTQ
ncbi:MAG: D-alanyl-D-alanine carboxypeptidase [Pseudorhizobium sp.]